MQIKILLRAENGLIIPLNYNHQVQSAIYAKLREVGESDFWHDCGFSSDKVYKAFVFGALNGSYSVRDKLISFNRDISLEIRSPMLSFCDALQRSIELKPQIKLFDTWLTVAGAGLTNQHINGRSAVFTAETPIIAYRTDEDKHIHFYGPDDECHAEMLIKNFRRKYAAMTGMEPDDIEVRAIGSHKKVVTNFKGTWLNGWKGRYKITGDYRALEFLYNAGLGSKNSQGFGMLKLENVEV